jgi:hypothetical protein
MLITQVAMENGVWLFHSLREFPRTKGAKSEAHVLCGWQAARLPLAEFLGVGFHDG